MVALRLLVNARFQRDSGRSVTLLRMRIDGPIRPLGFRKQRQRYRIEERPRQTRQDAGGAEPADIARKLEIARASGYRTLPIAGPRHLTWRTLTRALPHVKLGDFALGQGAHDGGGAPWGGRSGS